jgi:hypothetical protein
MNTRKEYNDRENAPLVNPGITYGQWQEKQALEGFKSYLDKYHPDIIGNVPAKTG